MSIASIAAKAARKVVGDISTPEAQTRFAEARAVAERDLAASLHLLALASGEDEAARAFAAEHGVALSVEDRAGMERAVDTAKYQALREANPFQAARVGLGNPSIAYAPGVSTGNKTEELRHAQRLESNPPASPNLNPFASATARVQVDRALQAQTEKRDTAAERAWAQATPDPGVDQFGQKKGQ